MVATFSDDAQLQIAHAQPCQAIFSLRHIHVASVVAHRRLIDDLAGLDLADHDIKICNVPLSRHIPVCREYAIVSRMEEEQEEVARRLVIIFTYLLLTMTKRWRNDK